MRIIVFGMIGRMPTGGQTWLSLHWLKAFHGLGHDVWYVEDASRWPYDPRTRSHTEDCSYAVQHIAGCMARIGLESHWAYRFREKADACFGLSNERLNALYRSCDVLFTFNSAELQEEHLAAPFRVYIESDPAISQLRLANGDSRTRQMFAHHHRVFTYGENFGSPDCGVPLGGIEYRTTRQPIDLEFWEYSFTPAAPHFTTIGNYRQRHFDIEYNGEMYYWSKHHEWLKFLELPRRTTQSFELALSIHDPSAIECFERQGWQLISPHELSADVFGAYPSYIRASRAEFTVARDLNVRLRSGWFSERDACYLASGKPVVAQDTGFGNIFPTGEGLFAFSTIDEAVAAVDAINSDYGRHCRAARAIAEEYFEASGVARRLLDQLEAGRPRTDPFVTTAPAVSGSG
jgi:hypothetical protein